MSYTLPSVHEARPVAEVVSVAVVGELDPATVIVLQRRIRAALDRGERRVVIDLSALTVLSVQTSLMLGGALRRLASRPATFAVVASPRQVRRALALFDLDGIAFYPDVDAAQSALTLDAAECREAASLPIRTPRELSHDEPRCRQSR